MIRDGNHAHASRLVSVEYTEILDNNEDAFQNMSGLVSWIQNIKITIDATITYITKQNVRNVC